MTGKKGFLFAFILIITILLIGSACSKAPQPVDGAKAFVKNWNNENFKEMYTLLSPTSKKEISQRAFITRYQKIYSGINASHIKVTLDQFQQKKTPKSQKDATFTYHVKMDTIAGPLNYSGKLSLTKPASSNKKLAKWKVSWNPSLILKSLKKGQVVHVTTLPAKRGEIYDRNGDGLAINGKAVQIGIYPKEWKDSSSDKSTLAGLLGISENQIEQDLQASWVTPETFVPVKTVSALNSSLIEDALNIPGVLSKDVPARVYPCGEACSHLIGYVGTITKEELGQEPASSGYTENSVIGKKGLEGLFESKLRAQSGAEIQILDSDNKVVNTLVKRAPSNGKNVTLTIDSTVQETLFDQLGGDLGTAVALNPKTGDVLGLVSTPTFDPNQFVLGMSETDYQTLLNDPDHPLLNRFTQTYTPGSTLKPLIAAIGLNQNVLTPDTTLKINGKGWQKDASWGNYYVNRLDYLKNVNLRDALVYSDNIFFAQTALNIGSENLINGLKNFGFDEKLPFDYPLVKSQISNSGKLDQSILLANSGYGQGQVKVNPLHLAVDFTAFVDNGNLIQPRLILNDSAAPTYWKKGVISPENAKVISGDLKQVVNSPQGTAYKPYVGGLSLAGKTGTAEYKSTQGTTGKEDGWFVAYNTAPPNLLISMMIENVQNRGGSHYVVSKVKQAFVALK